MIRRGKKGKSPKSNRYGRKRSPQITQHSLPICASNNFSPFLFDLPVNNFRPRSQSLTLKANQAKLDPAQVAIPPRKVMTHKRSYSWQNSRDVSSSELAQEFQRKCETSPILLNVKVTDQMCGVVSAIARLQGRIRIETIHPPISEPHPLSWHDSLPPIVFPQDLPIMCTTEYGMLDDVPDLAIRIVDEDKV